MKYLKYYVNKNVHIIGIFEQFVSVTRSPGQTIGQSKRNHRVFRVCSSTPPHPDYQNRTALIKILRATVNRISFFNSRMILQVLVIKR